MCLYVLVLSGITPIQLTAIARSHVIPLCYPLLQTTLTQPVGVIDFSHGVLKKFQADSKTWQDNPSTVPRDLLQENLDWPYRVCAEGDGKVYVLNTRDMDLHCLDMASRQWADTRQVDTSYRARCAAGTYNNGRLYVSGGKSLNGVQRYNTMVSLAVARTSNSPVTVQQQPDMLYRRTSHGMAGVERRILVCGGMEDTAWLANTEVFDLRTGTWSRLADMPVAKTAFSLISTATAVFELGGITRYLPSDVSPTLSDTVSVFDWETRQWTPLSSLPMPLCAIQGVYRGGSLWVLAAVTGARTNENNPDIAFHSRLQYVLQYDVTQQRWITHHNTPDVGNDGLDAYAFPL